MSKTLLTKELLDILEKKLTGTNSRSVHLNADKEKTLLIAGL